MEQYSAFEKDNITVNRPAGRIETIVGVDSHQFSNKSEARFIEAKNTKKSETGISVLQRRSPKLNLSTDEGRKRNFIASFQGRLDTSAEQADEALKVAVYYNGLINIEINRREVWEEIVRQKMGGYLNFKLEILANGEPKMSYTPGTNIGGNNKSTGFSHLEDFLIENCATEPILEILKDCDEISSLEELTKYDRLASVIQALFGDESLYADYLSGEFEEQETQSGFVLGANTF